MADYKEIETGEAYKIWKARRNEIIVLDVRRDDEFYGETGHIENAVHIPIEELDSRVNELDKHKEIYVICYAGTRSAQACQILAERGFTKLFNIIGGMMEWSDNNFEVVDKNLWPNVPKR